MPKYGITPTQGLARLREAEKIEDELTYRSRP